MKNDLRILIAAAVMAIIVTILSAGCAARHTIREPAPQTIVIDYSSELRRVRMPVLVGDDCRGELVFVDDTTVPITFDRSVCGHSAKLRQIRDAIGRNTQKPIVTPKPEPETK